jgi:hypothetical protein
VQKYCKWSQELHYLLFSDEELYEKGIAEVGARFLSPNCEKLWADGDLTLYTIIDVSKRSNTNDVLHR